MTDHSRHYALSDPIIETLMSRFGVDPARATDASLQVNANSVALFTVTYLVTTEDLAAVVSRNTERQP